MIACSWMTVERDGQRSESRGWNRKWLRFENRGGGVRGWLLWPVGNNKPCAEGCDCFILIIYRTDFTYAIAN